MSDLRELSREALEVENHRLRQLLETAGLAPYGDAPGLAGSEGSSLDARIAQPGPARGGTAASLARDSLVRELLTSRTALQASEERLALAFAASDSIGWWDWDLAADKIHAGAMFASTFGVAPEEAARGLPLSAFLQAIHPDDRDWVAARIGETVEACGEFAEEYRLRHPDRSVTWIHARGRCYRGADGEPSRFPGVALDVTERKQNDIRKSALVELGERLREIDDLTGVARTAAEIMAGALDATRTGIGTVDQERETVVTHPDWCAEGTVSLSGLYHFRDYGSFVDDLKRGELVLIGDVMTDPRTRDNAEALLAIGIRVLVNLPIIEHGRLVTIVFVHHDTPHVWNDSELDFVRTVADRVQAAIGRLRAEEQQRLLNRELSHRLKNNIAMVQAIATQTLRNAPSVEAARRALGDRLVALSRAHDLLLEGSVNEADLGAVVEGALSMHDDGEGRIRCAGPRVEIGSAASLSLAMILHELATNAAKYGALSVPEGVVEVAWQVAAPEGREILSFTWRERQGPPVVPPTRRGFGSRLIERGLAGSIGGAVALDYHPDGLVCRMTVAVEGLRRDG